MKSCFAALFMLAVALGAAPAQAQPGSTPQTLVQYVVERLNASGRHA